MTVYRVTVEHKGRIIRPVYVEAASPMLACKKAERYMAMEREGHLDNLPEYFASEAHPVQPPAVTYVPLGSPIHLLSGRF